MNEPWNQTQTRLRKWQKESTSGWELRRILSDSEYFKVIAMCAHKRVKSPPKHVGWQDWWAFYLERMPERDAMQVLLDVWNKDVWTHINHQVRSSAHQMLEDIAEQSRLAHEFSVALDNIVSGALPSSSVGDSGQGARGQPDSRDR